MASKAIKHPPKGGPYISSEKFAEQEYVAEATVRTWRTQGKGPRYIRYRGRILYAVKDIKKWQEEQIKPITPRSTTGNKKR